MLQPAPLLTCSWPPLKRSPPGMLATALSPRRRPRASSSVPSESRFRPSLALFMQLSIRSAKLLASGRSPFLKTPLRKSRVWLLISQYSARVDVGNLMTSPTRLLNRDRRSCSRCPWWSRPSTLLLQAPRL
ncbi:hypothetical protein [Lysobacter gummosus]|uniref:hypothetical protein n=1 Tax=Lysobacter gummosus TaxID=262324 RepID=UPI00363ED014